jgi:hypothetical protein
VSRKSIPRRGALAVLLWCAAGAPAHADPGAARGEGYLARLAAAVRSRLAEAAAAHVAPLVPPVRVAPTWKPQKLGSLDLGAPIAAVAAAELDGDGKAELYLVTARDVIAVGIAGRAAELGRVAFTGEPAVPASRDVVGTAVVEGNAVIAAVSAWDRELRVEWRGKTLSATQGASGFRVCGERVLRAPGRNHFREGNAALFGARCRGDLTDAAGHPLYVRGELSASGTLDIAVARCAAGGVDCRPAGSYRYKDVGVAFEIGDVDRDGTPDVIVSSASAPGDPDAVRVFPLGAPANRPTFKKPFNAGVAGLVVADGDGDGVAEVLAVVRLAGATRVDIWRLD